MTSARFAANDIISLIGATPRYELGESVGPDVGLGELFENSGADSLADLRLGYGTPAGDPRLRAAIAQRHGVTPDDVVITVGGMHALFLIALTLIAPGQEAVGTAPMFPLARNVLGAVGARVNAIPLSFEHGYQLDLDEVAAALSENTRLVSLASPHNPSGVSIPPPTLAAIVRLVMERAPRAYLLIDETYREAAYADDPVQPSAAGLHEKIISVASLSKCHGAPGLRIGWAITRDRDLLEQLTVAKFNTVVSCSAVDEALAIRVMDRHERLISERRQTLADGLARTMAWVETNQALVEWVRPDAGAICCIRLKPTVFDATGVQRVYDALSAQGVRVANGTWFGDEARVFRLGFGFLGAPQLDAALDVLGASVQRVAATWSLSQV
jgi:aspartate/methionine/tyrosine aminotransferase